MVMGLIGILWLSTGIAAAVFVGHASLRPLGDAMRRVNAPTRFALSDLIWLAVLIQLAVGGNSALYRGLMDESSRWFTQGMLIAAAIGIWIGGVSTMSRAGINDAKRRGIFTLLVIPLAIGLMMGAIGLVLANPILLHSILVGDVQYVPGLRAEWTLLAIAVGDVGVIAGLVGGVLLLRWIAKRIVAPQTPNSS